MPRRIIPPPIPNTAEMEEVINATIIRIRMSIFYPSTHPFFGRRD
jgi:hypothetical protein